MNELPSMEQCNTAYEVAEYFYELASSWKEGERIDLPFLNQCSSLHLAISSIMEGKPLEDVMSLGPFQCFDHPEVNILIFECVIALAGDKEDINPEIFYDLLKKRFYYANFDQN